MKICCTFLDIRSAFLNSECMIPNIRDHSCDRPECFYHAKNIWGAFEVEKYWTAFELLSDCILNILTGRTAFQQHSKHSDRLRRRIERASHFKSCQNVPNAPRMHFDCCRNLFRYYKNSAGMQFKCRRNLSTAARIQLKRPDWPSNESERNSEHRRIAYLGIY